MFVVGRLVTVVKVILSQVSIKLSSDNHLKQFRHEGQVGYWLIILQHLLV